LSALVLAGANGAFDAASTLARHEIAGLTQTDMSRMTHRRIVELGGRPVPVELELRPEGVLSVGGDGGDPDGLERLVRHWFDLDTDVAPIDRRLGADPRLAAQVRSRPGIRITRHPDAWEGAALTVLGQQVSLRAARTFGARLVAAYGDGEDDLNQFPDAARVAEEPVGRLRENLGVTGSRARTIHEVAALFAARAGFDPVELAELHGIGPWTVACLSIRAGTERDEFPSGDAVLRRALDGVSPAEAAGIALDWQPFRSYAAVRLWTSAVGLD
jgi:3-methyladenine DNA glycosylase/8-oxoguanine DNA glycosylase